MATTVIPVKYRMISCDNLKTTCAIPMISDILSIMGYKMLVSDDSLKAIKDMIELLDEDEEILILTNLAEESVYAQRIMGNIIFG